MGKKSEIIPHKGLMAQPIRVMAPRYEACVAVRPRTFFIKKLIVIEGSWAIPFGEKK
jgi:hypothetical protein